MKLYPIETGNFKLDGGAMFGVVPKTIWNKTNPADENNLIDIAARCLLIEQRPEAGARLTCSIDPCATAVSAGASRVLEHLLES